MKSHRKRKPPCRDGAGDRATARREPPLRTANLGSPIFVERWNGGSPLNWVEFMGGWERTRADRGTSHRGD
jgi:hypothetical protein